MDGGGGLDQTPVHGQGCHKRLHGRAWLKTVGERAVAQLLTGQVEATVGVEAGVVGQGQDFACARIEHHHTTGLGFLGPHGVDQFLISKVLNLAVDRELQILAIHRWHDIAHILHHTAQSVFDDAARTGFARELAVKSQLHTLLPLVLDIREADQMRGGFALGVLALVNTRLVDARDFQRRDVFGHRFVHLPIDPNKGLVLAGQALAQIPQGHLQEARQLGQLGIGFVDVFGNGPNALGLHAGGQDQTIAVQDSPTVGWQVQGSPKTHLTLGLIEVIANDLDVGCARGQTGKTQSEQTHHELAAPHRCFARQQRAVAEVDAVAAHGRDSKAGACGSKPVTYWVMPGVTARISKR